MCSACLAALVRERWGAARMLRSGGVDQFALAERTAALGLTQAAMLQDRFDAQRDALAPRFTELRALAPSLLTPEYTDQIGLSLLLSLPGDPGRAHEIEQLTALVRLRREGPTRETIDIAAGCLWDARSPLALEAAMTLADPRTRHDPWPRAIDWLAVAKACHERHERAWLAAAFLRARQRRWSARDLEDVPAELRDALTAEHSPPWIGAALEVGLASPDPLCRLECALALERTEEVARFASDPDEWLRALALFFLAERSDARCADTLRDGPDDLRHATLRRLPDVPSDDLVEPLLRALEQGGQHSRESAAWKLAGRMSRKQLDRVLAVAAREQDGRVLNALLRQERIGEADHLLRALTALRLLSLPWVSDALKDAVREQKIPADTLRDLVETHADAGLLPLAEVLLDRALDERIDRAVTRIAFLQTRELRVAACWVLSRSARMRGEREAPFRLSVAHAERYFGATETFMHALCAVLADDEGLLEVGYYDWLASLIGYCDDPAFFAAAKSTQLPAALQRISADERFWAYLRSGCDKFLEQIRGE
jgi:hypothetical protein